MPFGSSMPPRRKHPATRAGNAPAFLDATALSRIRALLNSDEPEAIGAVAALRGPRASTSTALPAVLARPTASSSSTAVVAAPEVKRRRLDAPVFAPSRRADRSAALTAATSLEARCDALSELERDKRAASSAGSQVSLLATWIAFHTEWFATQGAIPPFPLDVDKINAVSAMYKRGGYRSFPNSLSRAKREHIQGSPGVPPADWTEEIELVAKDCSRSVLRGIGPARQTLPVGLLEVARLRLGWHPLVEGVRRPHRCLTSLRRCS